METENLWFGEATELVYYRDPDTGESEALGHLADGPPELLNLDLWGEWLELADLVREGRQALPCG